MAGKISSFLYIYFLRTQLKTETREWKRVAKEMIYSSSVNGKGNSINSFNLFHFFWNCFFRISTFIWNSFVSHWSTTRMGLVKSFKFPWGGKEKATWQLIDWIMCQTKNAYITLYFTKFFVFYKILLYFTKYCAKIFHSSFTTVHFTQSNEFPWGFSLVFVLFCCFKKNPNQRRNLRLCQCIPHPKERSAQLHLCNSPKTLV